MAAVLAMLLAPSWANLAGAQATIDCTAATAATPAPVYPAEPLDAAFPDTGGDLTVFAAASLTGAFERIAADLAEDHPDLDISYNFAGSQALVTQLVSGAEADLLATADAVQMRAAEDAGLIDGGAVTFTHNNLVIAIPADNPAEMETPADLATEGVKLVIAAPEVPAGRYALDAICRMAADPDTYGEGFAARVGGNIVSHETSVTAVLAKVRLGEADAGIVYVSDLAHDTAHDVAMIPIPDEVNVLAGYPAAPIAGGDTDLARAFIAYLFSPEGQATLHEFGFVPANDRR